MNPPPQSAAKRVEPDDEHPGSTDDERSELDRFTDLTRKLLKVPKAALDERLGRDQRS